MRKRLKLSPATEGGEGGIIFNARGNNNATFGILFYLRRGRDYLR
jgi:hypothetical protein